MFRSLNDATVVVVGLGLMGGSLAADLCTHRVVARVRGVSRRPETGFEALQRGWIDEAATAPDTAVRDADLVVMATPVLTTISLLKEIGPFLQPGAVVTDLGSTKSEICSALSALPPGAQPIGGHPMCGKELSGLEAAEPGLYENRVWVLTPIGRTSNETIEAMRSFVEAVGARPLLLEPGRHDRLVAAISHLPYMLAASLVSVAEDFAADDPLVWELASSGFRDTSRLAASETNMMRDILLTNRQNVRDAVRSLGARLTELEEYLDRDSDEALVALMARARERREGMFR